MKKQIRHLLHALLIGSVALFYLNCKKMKQNEKYRWRPASCAPGVYPTWFINGYIYYSDGRGIYIPDDRYVANGWGGVTSIDVVGDDNKPVPVSFYLEWYSFSEDKFYRCESTLPTDTIRHLFEEGYISERKRQETYENILFGAVPGGTVIVWMVGFNNKIVEIGCYQGEEVERSLTVILREYKFNSEEEEYKKRKDFRLVRLNKIAKKYNIPLDNLMHPPLDLYSKTYRERYSFRVVMDYQDTASITDEIYMEFLNGEAEILNQASLQVNPFAPRARISAVRSYWSSGRALKRSFIHFEESEIVSAYAELYEDLPRDMSCELHVRVNRTHDHIRIFLCAVGTPYPKEVELLKAKIHVLDDREGSRKFYTVFQDEKPTTDEKTN